MKHATRLLCCVALCGVVSNVALAERRERPVRVPSTGVLPVVHGVASLTVSGETQAGEQYWQQYQYQDGDQPPAIYNSFGQLPNGSYRYEFVSIPNVAVAADSAAPESDIFVAAGGEERPARIESGSFTMSSGSMIFH